VPRKGGRPRCRDGGGHRSLLTSDGGAAGG
jgi:hypothetical protein